MIGRLTHLCDRASAVPDSLPEPERADGRRLIAMCQDYADRAQESQPPHLLGSESEAFIRELARLVEYLGRRSALGIPLATLGRAVLAHRSQHQAAYDATCTETEQKLGLLGF